MRYPLRWQLFLRVKSKEKAQLLVERFAQATGLEVRVRACEKYWKDQELFRVDLDSFLPGQEHETPVREMLQVGDRVARRWVVGAPQFFESGHWEFSGSALDDTITLPGVTYIDFCLRDREKPVPSPVSPDKPVLQPS